MKYVFEEFTLDTDRCEVRRGEDVVSLRPKAFALLTFLLERPRKVATKDELLAAVWSGLHVSDDSLKQCVSDLRHGLGATAARLVRTVPRRGYMLETDVERLPDPVTPARPPAKPARRGALLSAGGVSAAAVLVAAAFLLPGPAPAPRSPALIMDSSATTLGQPFAFPAGPGRMVAQVKVLSPGAVSEWHRHDHPVFAYVLRGTVVVDYGARGTRRYAAGTPILEALDWAHQARNEGGEAVEILVVEMVAAGTDSAPTIPARPLP